MIIGEYYTHSQDENKLEIYTKGPHRMQHDSTTASRQGLPDAPDLLASSLTRKPKLIETLSEPFVMINTKKKLHRNKMKYKNWVKLPNL